MDEQRPGNPDLEQLPEFSRVRAQFSPKLTQTLRPETRETIGRTLTFDRAWTVTKEDGGPYVGQSAWLCAEEKIGWVPSEDLHLVEVFGG